MKMRVDDENPQTSVDSCSHQSKHSSATPGRSVSTGRKVVFLSQHHNVAQQQSGAAAQVRMADQAEGNIFVPPPLENIIQQRFAQSEGMRRSTLFILRKPLTSCSHEAHHALVFGPRDVERELHPSLASDKQIGAVLGYLPVRQQLARFHKDLRFRLAWVQNQEETGLRWLARWIELHSRNSYQPARSLIRDANTFAVGCYEFRDNPIHILCRHLTYCSLWRGEEVITGLDFHRIARRDVTARRLAAF